MIVSVTKTNKYLAKKLSEKSKKGPILQKPIYQMVSLTLVGKRFSRSVLIIFSDLF